jgi:putative transposase
VLVPSSTRAIFKEYPQVKKQLWGGEFWEEGYFARTVGDNLTAEVIQLKSSGNHPLGAGEV